MAPLVCSCVKGGANDLTVVTGGFRFWGEPFLDKNSLKESDSPSERREMGD